MELDHREEDGNEEEEETKTLKLVLGQVEDCLLPKLQLSLEETGKTESTDFMRTRNTVVSNKLDQILCSLTNEKILNTTSSSSTHIKLRRSLLAKLLILLGEQHDNSKPWSSSQINTLKVFTIIEKLNQVLHIINQCSTFTTITTVSNESAIVLSDSQNEFFAQMFLADFKDTGALPRQSLFYMCLQSLHPKFKKETWKLYPASVVAFKWIISFIKYPYLSDFVHYILPPSLLFADDYNDEYKLDGIFCLQHGITNLTKADLIVDNWSGVLYNALMHLVNDKSTQVIDNAVPLLYSVLKLIEVNPHDSSQSFTKYDEALKKILFSVEFCTVSQLKPIWVHHLTWILDIMGHATLHWVDKICEILLDFTTTNDFLLWKNILQCTQVIIKNTWLKPVSERMCEIILRIVLNAAALDYQDITVENKEELFKIATNSMHLLKPNSDYYLVLNQLDLIKRNKRFHPKFLQAIKQF